MVLWLKGGTGGELDPLTKFQLQTTSGAFKFHPSRPGESGAQVRVVHRCVTRDTDHDTQLHATMTTRPESSWQTKADPRAADLQGGCS